MNAIQSMTDAQPSTRELNVSTRQTADAVEVAIRDNGTGIPPKNVGRLFGSFFSTKANGMGMGLPIFRSIVESHGGRISAANNPEGGACFSFTLLIATA